MNETDTEEKRAEARMQWKQWQVGGSETIEDREMLKVKWIQKVECQRGQWESIFKGRVAWIAAYTIYM